MSQKPPKHKLPRKLSAATDLEPDSVGRVETDAHDPSDLADAEPPQSASRAGRRGRPSKRHANYEVGHCRPPKQFQFKPGQSGNPKGRSPLSRNLKTTVSLVLNEKIQIRENGRLRWITRIEALVRTTMSRAFKGDQKALGLLAAMMKQSGYGAETTESAPELLQGVDHEAILKEYLVRVALEDSIEVDSSPDESTEASDPSKRRKA